MIPRELDGETVERLSAAETTALLAQIAGEQIRLAAVQVSLLARLLALQAQPGPAEELLDMPTVAKLLGLPESKVREMGRAGQLPVTRIGKYTRVRRSVIQALMTAGAPVDGLLNMVHTRRDGRRNRPPAPQARRADPGGPRPPAWRSSPHREPVGTGPSPRHGADGAAAHPDAGHADSQV